MKDHDMMEEIIKYRRQQGQSSDGYRVFELLQKKWHARVLLELCQKSPRCFSELKRVVSGISGTVLVSTLRSLEDEGLVFRTQFNEFPVRVEYSLTERGEGMRPIFTAMMQWERHYSQAMM